MNFVDAVTKNLSSSYADFNGRATRSEFWFFWLFSTLICIVAGVLDGVIFGSPQQKPLFQFVVSLALFIPCAGLAWRRTTDVGLPGQNTLFPIVTEVFTILIPAYKLVLSFSLMEGKVGHDCQFDNCPQCSKIQVAPPNKAYQSIS